MIVNCGSQQSTLSQWGLLMDELDRMDCAAVIDARSVTGQLTDIEAYLLALRVDDTDQLRHHRLAVVTTDDSPPDLDFFILSARNRGLAVESFDCLETAAAWAAG